MKKFFRLIQCENIKFYTAKYIWGWFTILLIILVTFSFVFEFVPKENNYEYISNLLSSQKDTAMKLNENINTSISLEEKESLKKALYLCNINILKLEYCLKNDLLYNLSNVWWFLHKLQLIFTGLLLLIITYISRIFDIENKFNMWKILYGNYTEKRKIIVAKLKNMYRKTRQKKKKKFS